MKPKPFSALNHLTVPCDISLPKGWIRVRTMRYPGRFSTRLLQVPGAAPATSFPASAHMTRTHKQLRPHCVADATPSSFPSPVAGGSGEVDSLHVNIVDLH